MFYALHGVVLSDSIQEFTQYSEMPRITSIVMKNQALYFFILKGFEAF